MLRDLIFEKNLQKMKKVLDNDFLLCYNNKVVEDLTAYGSIAQLGEHLPYKQRVIGSSPIVSTIFYNCGQRCNAVKENECTEVHLFQKRPGSSVG